MEKQSDGQKKRQGQRDTERATSVAGNAVASKQ